MPPEVQRIGRHLRRCVFIAAVCACMALSAPIRAASHLPTIAPASYDAEQKKAARYEIPKTGIPLPRFPN